MDEKMNIMVPDREKKTYKNIKRMHTDWKQITGPKYISKRIPENIT